MSRPFWSRGLVLVLVLALVAPPAFAAGSREPANLSVRGVLSVLWEALSQLISGTEPGPGAMTLDGVSIGESGPGMDPNG